MGEVDELENAVDERVAERDQRVERAVRHPDEKHAEELVPVLRKVDAEPEKDEPDEEETDCWNDDLGRPYPSPQCDGLRLNIGRHPSLLIYEGRARGPFPRSVAERVGVARYLPTLVTTANSYTPALPFSLSKLIHLFGMMSPFLSKPNEPMIPFTTLVLNICWTTDPREPFDLAIALSMICAAWA